MMIFARLLPLMLTLAEFSTMVTAADSPPLTQQDLFRADTDGYAIYRIPGVVVTARGTILAYCEARRTTSDWGTIDILLRRSTDDGRTWGVPFKVADIAGPKPRNPVAIARNQARPHDTTYNNPVCIASQDGTVHLLFCLEYMRCFYSRSDDDGTSWSTPVEITPVFEAFRPQYDWRVLATGPGHGIEHSSGRLLRPGLALARHGRQRPQALRRGGHLQ